MTNHQLYGGVEAGGTKFNCVIGSGPNDIVARASFPTASPAQTLEQVRGFFDTETAKHGSMLAMGVATFGPADINPSSPTYGFITSTPKQGWSNTNMLGYLKSHYDIPIGFETDVNGAALGEGAYGAAVGVDNFIYVTVGTGIGAGVVLNGALIHGVTHPEVGHMLIPQRSQEPHVEGCCPFHDGCLEGLASGPAIQKRWGISADKLPENHPAWEDQARHLAIMCHNLTLFYSPERIVLGGGVMTQRHLFKKTRTEFASFFNDYVPLPHLMDLDSYIVPTGLNGSAGELGALELAKATHDASLSQS